MTVLQNQNPICNFMQWPLGLTQMRTHPWEANPKQSPIPTGNCSHNCWQEPEQSQTHLQALQFCAWHRVWLSSSSPALAHTEVSTPAAGDPHPGECGCDGLSLVSPHGCCWEQAGSCSSSSQGTQWLWLGSANLPLIMRHAASF